MGITDVRPRVVRGPAGPKRGWTRWGVKRGRKLRERRYLTNPAPRTERPCSAQEAFFGAARRQGLGFHDFPGEGWLCRPDMRSLPLWGRGDMGGRPRMALRDFKEVGACVNCFTFDGLAGLYCDERSIFK